MKEMFQNAPKKDPNNKVIEGICAGIAKQLEVDAFWVRLAAVVLLPITGGFIAIVYIALIFIMETDTEPEIIPPTKQSKKK